MVSVVFITKGKMTGVNVDEKKSKLFDSVELGWDSNTFDISLSQILTKLKSKRIRVLLDNTISYTLRLSIPTGINEIQERKLISEKIKEKIPEVLKDEDWDYKEIQFNVSSKNQTTKGKEREVIVFSPVKYVTELLRKAKSNLNLEIEAIEAVEIAQTRNTNPMIGIALKEDIKGDDKDVLNIDLNTARKEEDFKQVLNEEKPKNEQVTKENEPQETEEYQDEEEDKPSGKKVIVTVVLILVIVGFLSVFGYMVYKNFFAPKPAPDQKTAAVENVTPTEKVEPSPTAKPTQEVYDLTKYRVDILNGSGIAGEAQNVVSILQTEGYAQFDTGNANSYNYQDTEISTVADFPKSLIEQIVNDLGDTYSVSTPSSTLANPDYDLQIIVGARK